MASRTVGPTKLFLISGTGYGIGKFLETSLNENHGNLIFHTLRSALEAIQKNWTESSSFSKDNNSSTANNDVTQQLQELSKAVAALSEQSKTTIFVPSNTSSSSQPTAGNTVSSVLGLLSTLTLATSLTWVWCKWNGIPLTELLYVTRRSFQNACQNLKERMRGLANAIEKVRQELSERMSNIEGKIDTTSTSLKSTIESEGQSIRNELKSMEERQTSIRNMVCGLEDQLNDIEQQTRFTSKGIFLLCSVVSSSNFVDGKIRSIHKVNNGWAIKDHVESDDEEEEDEEEEDEENPEEDGEQRTDRLNRQKLLKFTNDFSTFVNDDRGKKKEKIFKEKNKMKDDDTTSNNERVGCCSQLMSKHIGLIYPSHVCMIGIDQVMGGNNIQECSRVQPRVELIKSIDDSSPPLDFTRRKRKNLASKRGSIAAMSP
jgi:hypothetical protein